MTLNLDPIKTRANAATKGPWEPADTAMNYIVWAFHGNGARFMIADEVDVLEDANFISHARQDIPALLAEVEQLRGIVDRVREKIHTARHALHLTGDLDAREVLHHITTALEDQ